MSNELLRNREVTYPSASGESVPPDRKALRLAAVLFILGLVLSLGIGSLHPGRENANDHPAVFAEYAQSANWTPVHLGQFAGDAVIIAALLALYSALRIQSGTAGWTNRLAAASAVITLGLYGVLQAVDGVTLKRVVDAWVSAPAAEKAARFASAEAVRWLEEGVRSYQDIMLGITFLLFAVVIVWKAGIPKPIGYLMGLSGIAYLAQGWVLGFEGFSPTHGLAQLPAYVFILAWIIWLAVTAFRLKETAESRAH
jgi:hypothetical protein